MDLRNRFRPSVECRAIVGADKRQDGLYITVCSRFRGHFGRCKSHTRHSQIESFYDINRETWPDMSRVRALWSAWKCWRMTKGHTDGTPSSDSVKGKE